MTKQIYAIKIHDRDCEICLHMSKHDRSTFESYDGVGYMEFELDSLMQNCVVGLFKADPMSDFLAAVVKAVADHALNPDYTLDLPTYILLNENLEYLTHLTGANTVREIRSAMEGVKISSTV